MLARLRDFWVYGGALAALLLLGLTPVLARDWPMELLLIWLQLPAYMLHQYEEHDDDRFRRHVNATIGGGREVLTRLDVFVINIPGVWGVDAAAFLAAASLRPGLGLVAVYLSLVNGLAHVIQGLALRAYNPGLATSVLVFLPLGAATLWVTGGALSLSDQALGLGLSLAIHGAIIVRTLARRARLVRAEPRRPGSDTRP